MTLGLDVSDGAGDSVRISDVKGGAACPDVFILQQLGSRRELVGIAAIEHDLSPSLPQSSGERKTYAAR